ncbi:MAG: DNA-binding protein [Clostridia bacterium]|nr:DNA-binding protein [Clostridia bacterium]
MTIEDRVLIAELLAEYGALLTDKQRETVEMYCLMDLSLQEVADEVGTTRQAVRDVVTRTVASLEEYENKLGNVRLKSAVLAALKGCTEADWRVRCDEAIALLED